MRLFFSTECVDAWQLQERATLVDDQMDSVLLRGVGDEASQGYVGQQVDR